VRVVAWFSCGATSAIATKLALERFGPRVTVAYCDTGSEHDDNVRFMADCERWLGMTIEVVRSERYKDIWEVFEKTRYLAGVRGARCTVELKKGVRERFQEPGDLQVFGFDSSEAARAERFRQNNPDVRAWFPLLEAGLSKQDCLDRLIGAGIELPAMYRLGYTNNNCIGCVKGQSGYWNKIRRDFPEVFARMAKLEREIGAAICKSYATGERERVFLDELPPDAGRYESELDLKCGLICGE
jgi:3'-phosphoadenosine 5'-phosphosulfate sulfotransferase (PAPS reductase)/FAD synthetase